MRLNRPLMLLMVPLLLLAAACGGGSNEEPGESATPAPSADGGSPAASGAVGSSSGELARAVVQIHAVDASGGTVWTGSGTFISADGLILTNGHVVDTRSDEYDHLAVATIGRTDQPAELAYLAEIVAVDYALDLAVIQIASDLDGGHVSEKFPYVAIGDSDEIEIGDEVRILGYPGIGGDTITFTKGSVSGFSAERSVGGRAWIKTDATIAGGNSGGLAVNAAGELVGIPTIVGSGADAADFVDCRFVVDTNGDGEVGTGDDCVPVGGFINGMRPSNLAAVLIEAAINGVEYVSEFDTLEPDSTPDAGFDTASVIFSDLIFADGVTGDNQPVNIYEALPSGVYRVCGFWDYEGMSDGVNWEALWFVDGELDKDGSFVDDTWVGGESGNWWVCILDEEQGLADGLYELVLSVDGEFQASGAVHAGGDHPPVKLTIDNHSSFDICYAYLSPSGAQNWGEDDLGGDTVDAGASLILTIPGGAYDILTRDCGGETITEDYDLDLSEDAAYTVTDLQ